jgi:hypothetical protein
MGWLWILSITFGKRRTKLIFSACELRVEKFPFLNILGKLLKTPDKLTNAKRKRKSSSLLTNCVPRCARKKKRTPAAWGWPVVHCSNTQPPRQIPVKAWPHYRSLIESKVLLA